VSASDGAEVYCADNVVVLDALIQQFAATATKVSAASEAVHVDRKRLFRVAYDQTRMSELAALVHPKTPASQTLHCNDRIAVAHTLTGIKWRCQQLMGLSKPTNARRGDVRNTPE
jgi:hypothetical protein